MSTLLEHLTGIYSEHGKLTPALVVDQARPKSSPLHDRFEWNDKVAGEAYRRVQASELIRSVRVFYSPGEDEDDRSLRAFVASRPEHAPDESTYRPIEEVIADPFAYQLLLNECKREWKAFESKYRHLREFHEIIVGEVA